jgi:hypothetical protein
MALTLIFSRSGMKKRCTCLRPLLMLQLLLQYSLLPHRTQLPFGIPAFAVIASLQHTVSMMLTFSLTQSAYRLFFSGKIEDMRFGTFCMER